MEDYQNILESENNKMKQLEDSVKYLKEELGKEKMRVSQLEFTQ